MTGKTPRVITLAETTGPGRSIFERRGLLLPRGYLPTVISTLGKAGLTYHVRDQTVRPSVERLQERGQLYDYQERALKDLLREETGVLEAPPGSGKTNMLLSAIARLRTTALILVHITELFEQTLQRASDWLGIQPGFIGSGREEIRPVTVATIQSVVRRNIEVLGRQFGAVLVDEAHHSPATTWAAILAQMPARHKYGFTATPWRKDGLDFLIWRLIGPPSAKIASREVKASGKIICPRVEKVPTQYFFPVEDSSQWTQLITDLSRDRDRNELLTQEVSSRIRQNPDARALLLTDRIEHAKVLAESLKCWNPVLLTGEVSKRERAQGMERVRSGARLTIATVHLMGEGVNIPGWDVLFLAAPFSGGPRTIQAAGRVARSAPGKEEALIIDFVDERVPILKRAWKKREQLYRKAGCGLPSRGTQSKARARR